MNRLAAHTAQIVPTSSTPSDLHQTQTDRTVAVTRLAVDDSAPCATFAPVHYESGYAYPLVVWLHGAEGNERQLSQIMPLVSMRNYVAVAPRGSIADRHTAGSFTWQQTPEEIATAEERVAEAIDYARTRFHVNDDRIFLAGYGSGGTMALRIAWNQPGRVAGVASFGGPLPREHRPLQDVNRLRTLPLLLATGRHSHDYCETQVCHDLRLLHAAGLVVALRQYPCGDELTSNMLADFNCWMMDIVCGTPNTVSS